MLDLIVLHFKSSHLGGFDLGVGRHWNVLLHLAAAQEVVKEGEIVAGHRREGNVGGRVALRLLRLASLPQGGLVLLNGFAQGLHKS